MVNGMVKAIAAEANRMNCVEDVMLSSISDKIVALTAYGQRLNKHLDAIAAEANGVKGDSIQQEKALAEIGMEQTIINTKQSQNGSEMTEATTQANMATDSEAISGNIGRIMIRSYAQGGRNVLRG